MIALTLLVSVAVGLTALAFLVVWHTMGDE